MSSYQLVRSPIDALRGVILGGGTSLLAFGLNTLVSEALYPSVLPLYFGAVVITAWYGGTVAALTCMLVSMPGVVLLVEPRYQLAGHGNEDVLRIFLFGVVSSMVILLDFYRRRDGFLTKQSREELAKHSARHRLAINVGRMGTWEWDIKTRRITWSGEAAEMHGAGEGVRGASPIGFLQSIHPEDREATQLAIARSLQQQMPDIDMEYRAMLPNGETRWIEGKGRVQRDRFGNPTGVVGVVRDITARKQAEIELLEYAERLRLANTVKDEFLGMVSHELRNPITAVLTGARILRRRYDTLDPATREEVLNDVAYEAERLQLIVENLLSLARDQFGAGTEPEPVSVNRAVEAALSRARRARPAREYVFSRNGDTYASIVPLYLDLVLRNLLDNADKYSPARQPIELAARQDDDFVLISVRDHGPGVGDEERERLFDRFYRAPDATGVYGAGIGLTVCQRLLQNQGGEISCDNATGGGLIVEVRVPACDMDDIDEIDVQPQLAEGHASEPVSG
jgi:PAS domain S-box-containing protein